MGKTVTMRVPEHVQAEAKRFAGIQGIQPGDLLGEAWAEYLQNHRDEFAANLEKAAKIVREGTTVELASFMNGNVDAEAAAHAERFRSSFERKS